MRDCNVLPGLTARTEGEVRRALSRDLNRLCQEHGPQRVGLHVGCDERTIRNARDETTTLKLHTAFNLLALDAAALDSLLAEYGLRAVPVEASDATAGATRIVTRMAASTAEMTCPESEGGSDITDRELLRREDEIRASHRLTGWMLGRIDRLRGLGLRVAQ